MKAKRSLLNDAAKAEIRRLQQEFDKAGAPPPRVRLLKPDYQRRFGGLKDRLAKLRANNSTIT